MLQKTKVKLIQNPVSFRIENQKRQLSAVTPVVYSTVGPGYLSHNNNLLSVKPVKTPIV